LFLINSREIEYLFQVTRERTTVRRTTVFIQTPLMPLCHLMKPVWRRFDWRLTATNIFSVYAFGDLGSHQNSYNTEKLMLFRFSPEGKYVNKFVQSLNFCGIEIDNQSRIYVSDNDSINIYLNTGEPL
jgi:hypothetical protein